MSLWFKNEIKYNKYRKALKDCPFCGTNNNLDFEYIEEPGKRELAVMCRSCGLKLPLSIDLASFTMGDLVDKWNHRP